MKRDLMLAISGCSTGVVPAGPRTYLISVTEGSGDEWRMVPVQVDQHGTQRFGRYAGAKLTFAQGDGGRGERGG